MNRRYLLALIGGLVACHGAAAADLVPGSGEWVWKNWCHPGIWGPVCCPDDYCPKRMPCVTPTPRGCVDDYCPKTMPCVTPTPRGCVDDYCPKTMPVIVPPVLTPCHTCGPPDPCECPRPGWCQP